MTPTPKNERQTKFEIQALMAQVSSLMQSLLIRAYRQEAFAYREIARRFTLKKSCDFEVKKFQAKCSAAGILDKWVDIERWDVEIEQTLGGGNRMMELAQSNELMGKVNQFDPHAQAEIKHDWVLAMTNNAKKALRLAPLDAVPNVSDAIKQAEADFALAMQGIMPSIREGLNHIEQIERTLTMMAQMAGNIQKSGGVGTPQQVQGLGLAAQYVAGHMKILAQDPNEKQRVKKYADALGKLMNLVKAFAQRQAEAAKKAQAQNGAGANGDIAAELMKANAKIKVLEASAAQKLKHKNLAFVSEQRRKDLSTAAEIKRKNATAIAETFRGGMKSPVQG